MAEGTSGETSSSDSGEVLPPEGEVLDGEELPPTDGIVEDLPDTTDSNDSGDVVDNSDLSDE